jgi:hypothetical protein
LRPLPDGDGESDFGGGAGRESPIFGLAGKAGRLAPLAIELPSSALRAPFAASGVPAARSLASGTDAGRPVVGSDIGEIPSPGRAVERRGWHPASSTGQLRPFGALGLVAEIDSKNTFFAHGFAVLRAEVEDGALGDSEEDEVGDGGRFNRIRL